MPFSLEDYYLQIFLNRSIKLILVIGLAKSRLRQRINYFQAKKNR